MARLLSRSLLLRHGQLTTSTSSSSSFFTNPEVAIPISSSCFLRHRSSKSTKPSLIQIDLGSSSSSNERDFEMALKRFDELIQRVLVKKATPDWLPFVPGSSFWVPPRPGSPANIVDLVQKLTDDLTDEQCLSIASMRGWPSSNFFIQEIESARHGEADLEVHGPEEMGLRVQVKVLNVPENKAQSEDEEDER